jgi:hypothetical protein
MLRRNPVLQCPPPDKVAGKVAGTSAMRPRGLSIRSLNAAERDVGSTLGSNASSKRKSDELGAVEEEEKATKRITRDTLAEHGLATQIARQAASASAQAAGQLPPLDRTDLSKNTVQALKQYMSAAGLDTVGNKKQLVDRLAAHFSAVDAAPIEADTTPALAEEAAPDEAHAMQAEPPADDVEAAEQAMLLADELRAEARKLKIAELKAELKHLGLESTGNKEELVERLVACQQAGAAPASVEQEQDEPDEELAPEQQADSSEDADEASAGITKLAELKEEQGRISAEAANA